MNYYIVSYRERGTRTVQTWDIPAESLDDALAAWDGYAKDSAIDAVVLAVKVGRRVQDRASA